MKGEIDYEKMTLAEQLAAGLQDAISHAKGELTLRTTTLPAPAPRLSKNRVIAIRKKLRVSQAVFAAYLNVPTKTLQSWEHGARTPKAGEARLLQFFEAAPEQCLSFLSTAPGRQAGAGGTTRKATTRRRGEKGFAGH